MVSLSIDFGVVQVYLCEVDAQTVCVRPVLEIAVTMAPTVTAVFDKYLGNLFRPAMLRDGILIFCFVCIVFAAQREVMALSFALQPAKPEQSDQSQQQSTGLRTDFCM